MNKAIQKKGKFTAGWAFLIALFIIGCSVKARRPESILDTPENHYAGGIKLLENRKYDSAWKSFTKARELDPEFPPAYVGLALIDAYRKNFDKARENLDEAWSNADTDDNKVLVHIGRIRVVSIEKRKEGAWIKVAEGYFEDGRQIDNKNPALYYYMGVAYKRARHFDKAGKMFGKVLDLNTGYVVEAEHERSLVQKKQQPAPGS